MFHWSDAATAISKDLAASWFALVPDHVDAVRFLNMEAVPERTELDGANGETGSGDYFRGQPVQSEPIHARNPIPLDTEALASW